ncbi:hypothetical protein [Flavobacterium sp.]|jgi:hypothetical protein|uniref:hypothetical protein n=1 Tax=Flavobacterium sp. TaxID=239 RepID=UPI0037C0C4FD
MIQILKETVAIHNKKRPHLSNPSNTKSNASTNQMHQQSKIQMKTYITKNSIKNVFDAV